MLWLLLSLLAAFSVAIKGVLSKKGLHQMNEYVMAWGLRAFALPFLIPVILFVQIPALDIVFWQALVAGSLLNVLTTIMYMKAIKLSPLSITVPMIAFTPLFMVITSPIIVGEFPTLTGLIGIALIVFGAYLLYVRKLRDGVLAPFKRLAKEQGPLWMLGVALIWSVTSNIDKVAVLHSNPLFYIVSFNILIACILTPIAYIKTRGKLGSVSLNKKILLLIGLTSVLMHVFQMTALTMTLAAYVISIKRLGAIFAIIFGFLFFREKNIRQCLLGASIMILGVLFITLL